jgi:hypothetical protein
MPNHSNFPADVFDETHHAATMRRKLVRAAQLGPKYYLWDVPRYLAHRRAVGLPTWDGGTLLNPVREFHPQLRREPELPPGYTDALARLRGAGVRLTIPRARLEGLLGVWWSVREMVGDVIECGSYRGATALLLAVLGRMNGIQQRCLMLDTFAGMPAPSRFDGGRSAGEFAPPQDAVAQIGRWADALGVADRIEVHPGLFIETFRRIGTRDQRFVFAHIDANIYASTREACEFVLARLAPGGVVVFDDYNGVCDLGARLAIDQSLRGRFGRPRPLAASSAYLRVPGNGN